MIKPEALTSSVELPYVTKNKCYIDGPINIPWPWQPNSLLGWGHGNHIAGPGAVELQGLAAISGPHVGLQMSPSHGVGASPGRQSGSATVAASHTARAWTRLIDGSPEPGRRQSRHISAAVTSGARHRRARGGIGPAEGSQSSATTHVFDGGNCQ